MLLIVLYFVHSQEKNKNSNVENVSEKHFSILNKMSLIYCSTSEKNLSCEENGYY